MSQIFHTEEIMQDLACTPYTLEEVSRRCRIWHGPLPPIGWLQGSHVKLCMPTRGFRILGAPLTLHSMSLGVTHQIAHA